MNVVLTFEATGTGRCLYTEVIPLGTLGRLRIRRATVIEFSDELQQWEVRDLDGKPLFRSPKRQRCLNWEQGHLKP